MKMVTRSFNQIREVNDYVNAHKIPKEHLVNIFSSVDGTFQLIYYEED